MPEYIILVSTVVCAAGCVTLYFKPANVPALAVAIFGGIMLLYGTGQYFERDNAEARALGFADAAERRAAQSAGISDSAQWKRQQQQGVRPAQPLAAKNPADGPTHLNSLAAAPRPEEAPAQPLAASEPSAKVTIVNFTARKTAPRYVEVSGTVINKNEFAIKNVTLTCGDKSYASGDVSVVLDKVVPARGDLSVAGLRLGPIRPELPPTTCAIARYERAD
jgi:hypothetical protein